MDSLRILTRCDLNLLTTLHTLIKTKSVSAAAFELGRTQPAVSQALNRLRLMFSDSLMFRNGRGLSITPFALSLAPQLERILSETAFLISNEQAFNPKIDERNIVVGGADIAFEPLVNLITLLRKEAPQLKYRISGYEENTKRLLNGDIDAIISFYTNKVAPGIEVNSLGKRKWATFGQKANKFIKEPNLDNWCNSEHVNIYFSDNGPEQINDALKKMGRHRKISLQVESFQQALSLVASSDLLFTTMEDYAAAPAARLGLASRQLPFHVSSVPSSIITRDTKWDPVARWLLPFAKTAFTFSNK